ncbi:MAG: LamG domain-containing protein [Opitutales bacterium]|nr:LamG domain-containing protein [Opitutales bacterium]
MKNLLKTFSSLLLYAAISNTSQGNLLAYFDFEDNLLDKSGNGVHATSWSGLTYTTSGYSGGAFEFSGSGSFVRIPLDINPSAQPQLTMGAWVRPTSASVIQTVISHDNGGFDRSLVIDSRGTGSGWAAFTGSGVLGSFAVTPGEWAFVAAVYDQTAATTRLYVNGSSLTVSASTLGSGHPFVEIGRNPSFNELFQGTIDEVFIFGSALSDAELDDIRLNGVIIPEPATGALFLGLGTLFLVALRHRRKA